MWYRPANEASLSTPALLVYPDRIAENIRRMVSIAGGAERLRPHVKTHKIAEIVELQLGQGITRFKCATLTEVEMVSAAGGRDILLAYPLLGPGVVRFLDIMERYPDVHFAVTVDSVIACGLLEEGARARGKQVEVFVDIDNGMHRTGIPPEKSMELIRGILERPNMVLRGLHIYDGHIHGGDLRQRKERCDRDFEPVMELLGQLESKGVKIGELACGGTPTFPVHALYVERTLCPGTTLLWDAGYGGKFADLDFLYAAVVVARVISKPAGKLCLDLGHKSVASEMPHPRVKFLGITTGEAMIHSEEHLVVESEQSDEIKVGDLLYVLPVHICPTMALHERVYVVEKGRVTGSWEVAARKRSYLL